MEFDMHSLSRLLQSCRDHHSILLGKQIHLLFFKKGLLGSTLSLANRLLQMYSRCGRMTDVEKLFDEMPQRNCFSWNTLIDGYMKIGCRDKSLEMLNWMPHKNDFSWNTVIFGFAKAGELGIARNLFDEMPKRDAVAWNVMIHSYARYGCPAEAVGLFKEMCSDPLNASLSDNYLFSSAIGACTDLGSLKCGKQIHARILVTQVEFDSVLASSLINFYGKCGDPGSASNIFDMMACPDEFSVSALISGYAISGRMNDARRIFDTTNSNSLVIWNSMISGHVSSNEEKEALELFNEMQRGGVRGDFSTIASLLSACSSLGNINHGKQMHSVTCKVGLVNDVTISSALIDAYSKCGCPNDACKLFSELTTYDTILLNSMITVYSSCGRIEDAKRIFETMPSRSLISWNSMIVGLSQNGCPLETLDIFSKMNKMDLRMDRFSFASVISAASSISSLELGEQVFARATVIGLDSDQVICSSLVDFYCKCGFVCNGRKLFDSMRKSDEISWNSMLIGYATNGHGTEALAVFNDMRRASLKPTGVTFTGVLSACNHSGLVEEGWKWFNAMKQEYHIEPEVEHYSCIVDLFARSGHLDDAINLIEQMPYEADTSMWSSVLRGCVAHGCKTLGKKVAEKIIEFDPENSGAYVQLSSLFSSFGDWEGSALVRNMMREKQIQKNPGFSWADC